MDPVRPGTPKDDYPTTNFKWFADLASSDKSLQNAGATELCATYVPFIIRQLERKGLSRQDAEEVAQNVIVELVRNAEKYRQAGPRRFRDELRIMTARRGIDFIRKQKRHLTVDNSNYFSQLAISGSDESHAFERERQDEVYRKALEMLQAEMVPLHFDAFRLQTLTTPKRSGGAVAAELGITAAAAYQHKSRCIRRLREIVAALGGDPE